MSKMNIERKYARDKKGIYPKNKDRKGNYGKYEIETQKHKDYMKEKLVKCLEKQDLTLESPLTCILLGDYFSTLVWQV